jgi:hypothetical protein
MPFSPDALEELLKRTKLSPEALARELPHLKQYFCACSPTSIKYWVCGKHSPRDTFIDALYQFAHERGIKDLDFYVAPNRKRPSKKTI